jgi:hypothetical protein
MLSNHEGLKPNGILKMRRVSSFAAKTSLFPNDFVPQLQQRGET